MSNKLTPDEKKGIAFKPIFVSIGTYILFLAVVVLIGVLLSKGEETRGSLLLATVIEILIFRGIASLFIKKKKPFLSLTIGIALTTLLHVPDIYTQIKSYETDLFVAESSNIEKEFPILVQMARENVSKGLFNYLLSWFFNDSHFIPIFFNSIFLISYRRSTLKGEKWGRRLLSILKAFLPVLGIMGYFIIILGISSNLNSDDSALLNIGAQLFLLNTYLLTRLRKSQIEKQKERVKEKQSKYKVVPLILFSILIIQEVYLLFINPLPFSLINIGIAILFGVSIYFLFKKTLIGIYIGASAVIAWCVERIITSNYVGSEILAKGLPIISILFSISVLLILLNAYLVYRGSKNKTRSSGKTLREMYEEGEEGRDERNLDQTYLNTKVVPKDVIPLSKGKDSKFIIWGLAVSIFFLIWVGIFTLLGFKVNKEYFSYDVNICLEDKWEGDKYNEGIDDCVYWARYNDLTKDRDLEREWNNGENSFINCPAGCEKELSYADFRSFTDYWEYSESCEDSSVICNFSDYVDYIHYSNRDYLKSRNRDIFLNQCIEENCKRPPIIVVE